MYAAFDPTLEVRGMFLDMSRALTKVLHEGLIYKLRQVGISLEALALISSFLNNRLQRITLNGQSSNWLPVKADIPIFSLIFFSVYQ